MNIKIVTISDLIEDRNRLGRTMYEHIEVQKKDNRLVRKGVNKYYYRRFVKDFFELMAAEMIYNNTVVQFGHLLYFFIAEPSYKGPNYGSMEPVPMVFVAAPVYYKMRTIPRMRFNRKWERILKKELRSGHKYDNFEVIKNQIYAKKANIRHKAAG